MENRKPTDPESEAFLRLLEDQEKIRSKKVPGVRTVLVVLSARGMVFDTEALRQKLLLTYPEAAVFFKTTLGKPVGPQAPRQVDLLVDFTGGGMKAPWFFASRLKAGARVSIGRKTGILRPRIYDRVFDEPAFLATHPGIDALERERMVQKAVLALAGVSLAQKGDTPKDLGKSIALGLPPMAGVS